MTQPLLIATLLIGGAVAFAIAVTLPQVGGIGRRVWVVPHEAAGRSPAIWRRANWLFAVAGMLSTCGIVVLATRLVGEGSRSLAPLAAVLFATANVLWIVFSAYRAGVILWASEQFRSGGDLPSPYAPLAVWATGLGTAYLLLEYLATAALGGAVLETGYLPAWVGWLAVALGLLLGTVMVAGRPHAAGQDETFAHIPAWTHVVPLVVGAVLLAAATWVER